MKQSLAKDNKILNTKTYFQPGLDLLNVLVVHVIFLQGFQPEVGIILQGFHDFYLNKIKILTILWIIILHLFTLKISRDTNLFA